MTDCPTEHPEDSSESRRAERSAVDSSSLRATASVHRRRPVRFTCDGREVLAYEGDTVAAALLASGHRVLRLTRRLGEPRGLFCGMGVCFDCVVQVNSRINVRACQTQVAEGMRVETQHGIETSGRRA